MKYRKMSASTTSAVSILFLTFFYSGNVALSSHQWWSGGHTENRTVDKVSALHTLTGTAYDSLWTARSDSLSTEHNRP